jgi:hypothetical protein
LDIQPNCAGSRCCVIGSRLASTNSTRASLVVAARGPIRAGQTPRPPKKMSTGPLRTLVA